ncbi:MAG: hypothetical protein NVSMB44_31770 [Ktedonobacteraceae bacterium]
MIRKDKKSIIVLVIAIVVLFAGGAFFVQQSIANKVSPSSPSSISLARRATPLSGSLALRAHPTFTTPGYSGTKSTGTSSGTAPRPNGIYQFSGHNSAINADKTYVQGTYLGYYWSLLEPQQGKYNWDVIDRDIKPWAANNKKIILRVAASGWAHWEPNLNSGNATPQWVYDSGVRSVTETDQSVHPEYWNPKFLAAYGSFISALAQRYDGSPAISVIEIGVGDGGETKVDTRRDNPQLLQQWQSIGYSDPVWWDTIQKIITIYTSNFHATPLVVLPDSSFIGKTGGYGEGTVVDYAVKQGVWLQDDGLIANRTMQDPWLSVPHIEEQRLSTSQSGDSLHDDLQAALNVKAACVLIFADDINKPENVATLQQMDPLFL